MNTRMTPERLDEMRRSVGHGQSPTPSRVDELIAEIDRMHRLEAALADEGLVHYATDYALINTLDAFDVYRDQLRAAAQAEPGESK